MVMLTCMAAALYNVLAYRWEGVRIYVSSGPRTTRSAPASDGTAAPTTVSSDDGVLSSDGESVAATPPPRRRVLARGGRRVRS
jgi:hypothetical protein